MKAAYLTGIRTIELREAPEPRITRRQDVLLRVDVVGVCGSDMHYYRSGRIGDQVVQFPWIVGHECSATVLAVGPEATGLAEGDRVAVDPLVWCGQCDQCRLSREHTCRRQAFLGCPGQLPGCLCERIVMPAASCVKTPPALDAVDAALVEPFSIGLYAFGLGLGAGVRSAQSPRAAVLGAGPIGLSVMLAARAAGVDVCMTDIRDYRATLARQMGAGYAGNPHRQDVLADMLERCPEGLDAVFECAGEPETLDQAVRLLKPGGRLMLVGIPEADRISLPADTLRRKEITVQPVRRQNHCVEPAIDLLASGAVNLRPMVTHRYSLEQTGEAFATVADYRDGVVKAMIDCW